MRVGGVVVDDRVDDLADGDRAFDRVEEADKLLVPVALLMRELDWRLVKAVDTHVSQRV
jgi:hypothetical protein